MDWRKRLDEHRGPEDFTEVETHDMPISFRLLHPSGVSAGITARYVDQQGTFADALGRSFDGEDRFWTADVSLSYRPPKRLGRLRIQASNLWNEKFNLQQTSLAMPGIARELIIVGGWTFAF
jgi:outer membrane receptor for monomeric catechols